MSVFARHRVSGNLGNSSFWAQKRSRHVLPQAVAPTSFVCMDAMPKSSLGVSLSTACASQHLRPCQVIRAFGNQLTNVLARQCIVFGCWTKGSAPLRAVCATLDQGSFSSVFATLVQGSLSKVSTYFLQMPLDIVEVPENEEA